MVSIRDGIINRNMTLNQNHVIGNNRQFFRVYRKGTVPRGEIPDRIFFGSASQTMGDGVLIHKFFGRIVRGRRGRRPQESSTIDQSSLSSTEWNLFFPKGIKLKHGDVIVDRLGRKYTVISWYSPDTYKFQNQAVIRESM